MDEKLSLFGKHAIVTEGEFKGVTGIVQSIEIESTSSFVSSANSKRLDFNRHREVYCKLIVDDRNTISVLLDNVSSK